MELELEDIQAFTLRAFGGLAEASYAMIRITDAGLAGKKILEILESGSIEDSREKEKSQFPDVTLCFAFTFGGLLKLRGDAISPESFPQEFQEGIVGEHRSRILGDIEANAPERWRWGNGAEPVDVVALLFSSSRNKVQDFIAQSFQPSSGMEIRYQIEAQLEKDKAKQREPFGFRDGLSNPVLRGSIPERELIKAIKDPATLSEFTRLHFLNPGEILLSYKDGKDEIAPSPWVHPNARSAHLLKAHQRKSGYRDLGLNGTYMVIRELAQDVEGFWDCMKSKSQDNPEGLAEKLMGRTQDGKPLVDSGGSNAFRFSGDPRGLQCPVGAHIRRSFPRDTTHPDPEEAIRNTNRHRILRRGRAYEKTVDGKTEKGIVFICLNADFERQFEFVQHTWCNNPSFAELQGETDPIVGTVQPRNPFTIPADPVRRKLQDLPQFVTVKGGAYFFLPGLRALRFLCAQR